MKKTFLYVYILLKVIHKKEIAIPKFVDKKSIKQSSLNFDFLKNKKYDANDMDTID